jgi:hypothetical protein
MAAMMNKRVNCRTDSESQLSSVGRMIDEVNLRLFPGTKLEGAVTVAPT